MLESLPRIHVIALGGTIASVPEPGQTGASPRLSGADLLRGVADIDRTAEVTAQTFRTSPSGDLTIADIVALAGEIDALAGEFDGFVVTQGTDTLEETSFLLSLVLGTDKPVAVTGAMRNPSLPGADGPANLLAAVRVAATSAAEGLGPLVVIADQIHLPRYVRKAHTSSPGAFVSGTVGPIGWVVEDRVRIALRPASSLARVSLGAAAPQLPEVPLLTLGLGAERAVLQAIADSAMAGVVMEVFGGGHVPSYIVDDLVALAARVPVLFASRTSAGELYRSTYDFPGSESDLLARGLIGTGSLDGPKSRLALTVLLASGTDANGIRSWFVSVDD